MRESNIDGDTAALFFFQAVRIDASQSLYQCGFPVVYMAGGADNDRLHRDSIVGAAVH